MIVLLSSRNSVILFDCHIESMCACKLCNWTINNETMNNKIIKKNSTYNISMTMIRKISTVSYQCSYDLEVIGHTMCTCICHSIVQVYFTIYIVMTLQYT